MPSAVPHFDSAAFLKSLTHSPGVYRMLGTRDQWLYVGKAKDLKKRLTSYFRATGLSYRVQVMMQQMRSVEVTVTHTEAEALLLENNLIKQHRPRYNVLLRDDKSYPHVYVSTEHPYPRLAFQRGARRGQGRYFGPYASAGAVRDTLNLLQKLFRVRQCEDSFFRSRTRPCLQYQIGRCTAPCVGQVTRAEYLEDVQHAIQFLDGQANEVVETLIARMEFAAQELDYERAALHRDQIQTLRRISERQYVTGEHADLDIVACAVEQRIACVQVFSIRKGMNMGNKSFFPVIPADISEPELMSAFLGQYYIARDIPDHIVVSHVPRDVSVLVEMLAKKCGHHILITHRVRGERARWLALANRNVVNGLQMRLASNAGQRQRLESLQAVLGLPACPTRMECFDVSHTQGEATVASCVVFDIHGAVKADYRRFNIEGIEKGDDYAALRQAISRRYKRLKQGEGQFPDILFIDGGKGQLGQAERVLTELNIEGVLLVGVAKGVDRKPGLETLILSGETQPRQPPADSPALHLIQQIRDEAHRFAITGHRQRRTRSRMHSHLEQISGLGPKRRQRLLKHFGGMRGLDRAGVEEIAKVPGIGDQLAQHIYDVFHFEPG